MKSTDFTSDILKRNKRKEDLYLNTEYATRHRNNQIEKKGSKELNYSM